MFVNVLFVLLLNSYIYRDLGNVYVSLYIRSLKKEHIDENVNKLQLALMKKYRNFQKLPVSTPKIQKNR